MTVALTRTAHEADLTFELGDMAADELKVVAIEGHEGISELFEFRLELCSDNERIDLDRLVGQPCTVRIAGDHGRRYVNGIVRRFERAGEGSHLTYYSAEIVPAHWLLTQRIKSRVFEQSRCTDMSVPGIIRKVLEDAGIGDDRVRFALKRTYEQREFVVQYRESDMDFISRLMEAEGIFYFFQHAADGHRMVIGDSSVAHMPNPGASAFPFRDPNGLVPEREHVFSVRDAREIRIGTVRLDDFDFRKPKTDLHAGLSAERSTALTLSDYPGGYSDKSTGDVYARIRLEEQQRDRRVLEVTATVRGLTPGFTFTLTDHPDERLNREYLATQMAHSARQPQSTEDEAGADQDSRYETTIRAIPSDVPYRPPCRTTRPFVHGSQTALVVGPKDEEIYTDQYGRVKAQFHWDQESGYDENSSCWIRVSQGWAGGNYGMMFLPRVGQEVIVDFLEGNPDQPIITGRVYNNDHMPPYKLPDEKTKSAIRTCSSKGAGGGNEVRFEDAENSEQLFLHAEKDYHLRVKNDRVETVENDQHQIVGADKFELVQKNEHIEIRLDRNEKVGGTHSFEVAGDVGEDVKGNHSEAVGNAYYLKAGKNVVIEAGASLTLKVGGNFVKIDPAGVTILGKTVKINSGGMADVGSPVALKAPKKPLEADKTESGKNTTYNPQQHAYDPLAPSDAKRNSDDEEEKRKTSWIEIELVDDLGQPVPNEAYELTLTNGKVRRGRLDQDGLAHVPVSDPGTCQICFPNLDQAAWEKN